MTDPLGLWTLNVGINLNIQAGPVGFTVSGGVVVDGNGNVGTYGTIYGGIGAGADASIGVALGQSNAPTINDLAGPFAQVSGNLGAGVDAGYSAYMGTTPGNQAIVGGEVQIGVGVGGSVSGGISDTIIQTISSGSNSPGTGAVCR